MHYTSFVRCLVALIVCSFCFSFVPGRVQASSLDLFALQEQLFRLRQMVEVLTPDATPMVLGATTVVVHNDLELLHAIASSTGGETIQLAPGTYSGLTIRGDQYNQLIVGTIKLAKGVPKLSAPVTLMSQDSTNQAVIRGIDVRSSDHWHFKRLAIRPIMNGGTPDSAVKLGGVDSALEDSSISYGDATNWTAADWLAHSGNGVGVAGANSIVRNNTIENVYHGIAVGENAEGSRVLHNTVNGIGGDGMRLLGSNVLVDSNLLKNFKEINANHDDCAQSWGLVSGGISQEGIVRGITFQNNICINNENPNDPLYDNTQGFNAFDGSMQDWVVQNNVYIGSAYHGMSYSGAVHMIFRNNTVIDSDAAADGENNVWIRVSSNKTGTIIPTGNIFENNISNKFVAYGTSSTVTNSQVVKMADYAKYFRDWRRGDVRLLPSSPIQGIGADLDPAMVGSNIVAVLVPVIPAPILTFRASSTLFVVGTSTILTWNTRDAATCNADGAWNGEKPTSGQVTTDVITTVGSQTYSLTCRGSGGTVTKSVVVKTVPEIVTPPAIDLRVAASEVKLNRPIRLSWNVVDATACTAGGAWQGGKDMSGFESIRNLSTIGTHTFTLTCVGQRGTTTKSVDVLVTASETTVLTSGSGSSGTLATTTAGSTSTTPLVTNPTGLRITTFGNLNVRSAANGLKIGTQVDGAKGTVSMGSEVTVAGVIWIYVNFDSGVDGYVAKNYTRVVTSGTPVVSPVQVAQSPEVQAQIQAILKLIVLLQQMLAAMQAKH